MSEKDLEALFLTLPELRSEVFPKYLMTPPKSDQTLHTQLKAARVRYMKRNPKAKNGGGIVRYSARDVDAWLKSQILK